MIILIILGLLGAAILFGIFFLIFKLIWLLFKKKSNFWPLILSAVATVLLIVGTIFAAFIAVRTVVRPFTPIIERIQTQTAPVYGTEVYTDTRYPFQLAAYNGMTFSDWLDWDGGSILVGVDTNAFLSEQNADDRTLAALAVLRQVQNKSMRPTEIMAQILEEAENNEQLKNGTVSFSNPETLFVGSAVPAAYITGTYAANNQTAPGLFSLLIATQDNTVYYLLGIDTQNKDEAQKSIRSFRFNGPALPLQ